MNPTAPATTRCPTNAGFLFCYTYAMFKKGLDEDKVRKIFKRLAPLIVADVAKQNFKLDYTISSLKNVDAILQSLHKEYVALGNNVSDQHQESYQGYSEMLGCYMLAVVDKNKVPGRLAIVSDEYGTAYGFTFSSGMFCDFISWCHKAIVNGKDDAIEPKFTFFSQAPK